ncbi:MAG: hypothetical protein JWR40_1847 [Massilia sp.]|jgi:hypothetical protein|nr:hypothetical protein [Massilia sp.]MDB5949892.1 hypothetical protein [Massilia sp.]
MISSTRRCIVALACGFAGTFAMQGAAAQAVSPAETLLFQTNHLHNVRAPLTLTYGFHKAGSLEPGFDDRVEVLLIEKKPGGKPSVTMHFLSGERQRPAPDPDNAEGNPALLGFLEHDIAEMQRLTGGSRNYFRKRIRLALAEAAQVRPTRFTWGGKPVDGREVSIEPYRNDPMAQRFERFIPKRYTFVISAQVPGGVYRVGSALAGPAGGAPLLEETLTLERAANDKH